MDFKKLFKAISFILFAVLASCAPQTPEEIVIRGSAFGTSYAVKYFGNSSEAPQVQQGIDSVVAAVNESMSTYIPESDISKINRGDSTIVVDAMFKEVFTLSRKLNKATAGYFDPTVGVLRNAYGFGDTAPLNEVTAERLDSLMQMVGWDKVQLNENGTITKAHPGVYFDYNAIAKGYGIDRIGMFLEQSGFADFLVEVGGEVLAKGQNTSKMKPWRVGIESVVSQIDDRSSIGSVRLENAAMAGSGNYRKYRVDPNTGKRIVHTINPLTGSAEEIDILSANVIAPTCAEADAWATAFMAMGIARSKKVLEEQEGIEAYLTYDGGEFVTEGFRTLLSN